MKGPTIFDVARLAGVSRGTVDRVVYGRGRVSSETFEKVRKAIKELNYNVNMNAASLAAKQVHKFAYLIPSARPGEYWEQVDIGFKEGVSDISFCNLDLVPFYYDQMNLESFLSAAGEILRMKPRGVITNAVFRLAVTDFVSELKKMNIPFAFIDNKFDDLDYMLYYGVDSAKGGLLGASLMTMHRKLRSVAIIRLKRDAKNIANPNAPRRHAFIDYITENMPDCVIHTIFINPASPDETNRTMTAFYEKHPEVKHFAVMNSRLYLLYDWLKEHPDPDRMVIGFDDLPGNIKVLRDGFADILITHKIFEHPRLLLAEFVKDVVRGLNPDHRNNFFPIDILTRYNIDAFPAGR